MNSGCLFWVFTWLFCCVDGEFVDMTRRPGASGAEVVEAAVKLVNQACVIDDNLFLRRMAMVETHDGTDPGTYRSGYNGGIWKVDEAVFNMTKTHSPYLQQTLGYDTIKSELHIDWTKVKWEDLRQPMISCLAAALYVKARTNGAALPAKTELQGAIWGTLKPTNVANDFVNKARSVSTSCGLRQELDIVIGLDFVRLETFSLYRVRSFLIKLLSQFRVSSSYVRIGIITKRNTIGQQRGHPYAAWNLNTYVPNINVTVALGALTYVPGTGLEDVLKFADNNMFLQTAGMRIGSAKVLMVITDGEHYDLSLAKAEKARLERKGVTIVMIGAGQKVKEDELKSLASSPSCSNTKIVSNLTRIEFMTAVLQNAICDAPTVLQGGNYRYSCDKTVTVTLPDTSVGVSLKAIPPIGQNVAVHMYGSIQARHPSAMLYDVTTTANQTESPVLFVRATDSIHVTIGVDENQASTCRGDFLLQIKMGTNGETFTGADGQCVVAGTVRHCKEGEMKLIIHDTILLPDDADPNICSHTIRKPEYYPHPLKQNLFLMCDLTDRLFLAVCPSNRQCLQLTSGCEYTNPCTSTELQENRLYHQDPCGTVASYIACSHLGAAQIKNCSRQRVWNEATQSCIFPFVHDILHGRDFTNIPNPCTHAQGDHEYYPYLPNATLYIFCDNQNNGFVRNCPSGYRWNQQLKQCSNISPSVVGLPVG